MAQKEKKLASCLSNSCSTVWMETLPSCAVSTTLKYESVASFCWWIIPFGFGEVIYVHVSFLLKVSAWWYLLCFAYYLKSFVFAWVSVFHRYPVFSFLLSDMFSQKLWQKKSWWANHNSFGLRWVKVQLHFQRGARQVPPYGFREVYGHDLTTV